MLASHLQGPCQEAPAVKVRASPDCALDLLVPSLLDFASSETQNGSEERNSADAGAGVRAADSHALARTMNSCLPSTR